MIWTRDVNVTVTLLYVYRNIITYNVTPTKITDSVTLPQPPRPKITKFR